MYYCEECNLEFKTFQAKANHHRWKHLKYAFKNEENKKNAIDKIKQFKNIKYGNIVNEKVNCSKCNKLIDISYREGKKKEKYYCSRSCANSHIRTQESKKKISNIIKEKLKKGESIGFIKNCLNYIPKNNVCIQCGKIIGRQRKFCSKECMHNYRIKDYSNYQKYKLLCQFNFSLNDFPNEFEFSLIEQFGWYSAKNRGNNLNGISRDHMFSIKEGFLQNIDPKIISHPANCKLLRHNDNVSKNKKCSISITDLTQRIEEWNKKYEN